MFHEQAYELLDSPVFRKALDIEQEPAHVRERYGFRPQNVDLTTRGGAASAFGRNLRGQNLLLARRLVEAGVSYVNVYDYKQQGQNWESLYGGKSTPYVKEGIPAEYSQTTWCANMAIDFIREQKRDPWFFSYNCFAPHHPFDPPADYLARYSPEELPLPKSRPARPGGTPICRVSGTAETNLKRRSSVQTSSAQISPPNRSSRFW